MNLSKSKAAIVALTSTLVFTSCSDEKPKQFLHPIAQDSQNIISTRPQNSKQMIVILKLQNPSLLQVSERRQNETKIDSKLLEEIQKEQKQVIEKLAEISSEIKIVYRYKMVLNALAILLPIELQPKLKGLGQITYFEMSGTFARPELAVLNNSLSKPVFAERNSAKFIGAEKLNLTGITGKGIKVGVIDTGIDYTHLMFKGQGTQEAFKAIKPSGEATGFPNEKIVGGIDLVGTEFDAASPEFTKRIPTPDLNPIDEGGHGTHVAGTVAGLGDGVHSYNGMAPDADLFAIKVFGAEGSTSDSVVIAALEYAADPNGDGQLNDQLDIVNLSLGSSYGNPRMLYSEAIKNLTRGGTAVVASAGNSGHKNYITGSPGTTTDALSVAASVDDGDQNWRFKASNIFIEESDKKEKVLVEAVEAATSKKIADIEQVSGQLVDIGLAAQDLTEEQAAQLKGHVAFIERGQVSFNDKIKRAAKAGAIGVVLANNQDGAPFVMGTTDKFDFPAIMISKSVGQKIKMALKSSDTKNKVTIEFKSEEKIEKPELIDTLTDFSSKGPRSVDGFLKPEISAPGNNVISAKMGGGAETVQMSGTSMAAPHMAGVLALVKQAQPELTAHELKSVVMGTAKTIGQKDQRYPLSQQGSGRVQADLAAASKLVSLEPSLSLGEISVESRKSLRRKVSIKNLSKEDLTISLKFEGNGYLNLNMVSEITLKAQQTTEIPVVITLDATKMKNESIREMDGWIKFLTKSTDQVVEVYRVPVLAIAHKLSAIEAQQLIVQSTSERDAEGAAATVRIENKNSNEGAALLFNLLGEDSRKPKADSYMTADCDMQAVGYRIVSKRGEGNVNEDVLQVAVKTYKPMTTWNSCDVSVLIDADGDGLAEQELLGSTMKSIPNQTSESFSSTLLDATKARAIRKAFEAEVEKFKNDPVKLEELKTKEKYDEAILDSREFLHFNNSTVVVVEAAVSQLAKTADGNLNLKVILTHNEQSTVEMDDILNQAVGTDLKISVKAQDQSFSDMPETLKLIGLESQTVELTKGAGKNSLLLLFPMNQFTNSDLDSDSQSQILKPTFLVP